MTAENVRGNGARIGARSGFNEAAADDRGKLPAGVGGAGVPWASMRPRPMTAENFSRPVWWGPR